VRLSLLYTSATNWPIVPCPDGGRWMWSSRRNENWKGKPKYSEKPCHCATLSIRNPTWPDLGSNPGRLGGKPETNRLSYGTAKELLSNREFACRRRDEGHVHNPRRFGGHFIPSSVNCIPHLQEGVARGCTDIDYKLRDKDRVRFGSLIE
jgi:hypothetical protein